jgi:hypothetical protein
VRIAAAIVAATAALVLPTVAQATVYYVSASGSDTSSGLSTGAAWRSVGKVNTTSLVPGDSVRFEGGASFGGLLQPSSSGTPAAPITFASYGTGKANLQGGILLHSDSWLAFDNLAVDTGNWQTASARGVGTSSSGTGAKDIVVQNCSFLNVIQGLMLSNHSDERWAVRNNLIRYTRDSGILIFDPATTNGIGGNDLLFEGNTILDSGLDTTYAYPKHGVYSKGTNVTLRNNTIRRWGADAAQPSAGLSLRAHNTIAEGNVLSDGPFGIAWSNYDPVQGTSRLAYNRISNVTVTGIELDRLTGPVATVENFIVTNNTIVTSSPANSGRGIHTQATAGFIKLANNIVTGTHYYGLWVEGLPGGGFSEHNDLWDGNSGAERWNYNGTDYTTLASYASASGHGAGDLVADPLFDTALVPGASSPALDGGTTAVDASVSFVGDCTPSFYSYCGAAPDMGANEASGSPAPPPPPPPPAPAADTAPPALAVTGLTDGSTIARSTVLTATATDASGIRSVSFSVDGRLVCLDLVAPYSCALSLSVGWHRIIVTATDNAGNAATVSARVKASSRVLAVLSSHATRRVARLAVVRMHRFRLTMHRFRLTVRFR